MSSSQYAREKRDNERRIIRMKTWIDLAKGTPEHVSFIFHWIAYESASGVYKDDGRYHGTEERKKFHHDVTRCNRNIKYKLKSISDDIQKLLELRQSDDTFWHKKKQGELTASDWSKAFNKRTEESLTRLRNLTETSVILDNLFSNLSVVRNQVVHGGSSGGKSFGKDQVTLGERILRNLVPEFLKTIESNMNENWRTPPFPRVGEKENEECPPPWLK